MKCNIGIIESGGNEYIAVPATDWAEHWRMMRIIITTKW